MAEKSSREEVNRLCQRCLRPCKQPCSIIMLECPRFQPRPFKIETLKFQQMELFKDS